MVDLNLSFRCQISEDISFSAVEKVLISSQLSYPGYFYFLEFPCVRVDLDFRSTSGFEWRHSSRTKVTNGLEPSRQFVRDNSFRTKIMEVFGNKFSFKDDLI